LYADNDVVGGTLFFSASSKKKEKKTEGGTRGWRKDRQTVVGGQTLCSDVQYSSSYYV
jgi:hypothetical protein